MTEQLNIFKQGLTEEEFRVWEVVSQRRGREAAISVSSVALQARMTDVQVRSIVSAMLRNHGKLIGSATGNPPGFYILADRKELESHIRSLRHRGIMCMVRAAALSKQSIEDVFGQARLELEAHNGRV